MRSSRTLLCALALAVLPGGIGPGHGRAHAAVTDGAHGSGNPHFFFLPPIAPPPDTAGVFDGSLLPHVAVEVCELAGAACVAGPPLARFTSTDGAGSERLRTAPREGHYLVNWHTRRAGGVAGAVYRIRVLVVRTELGHADVRVVTGGKGGRGAGGDLALVEGQTLPIKFRIEQGAVSVLEADGGTARIGETGGTITTADGGVALVIPAGALAAETDVTVQRIATFPEGPGVAVPGTVFAFGPAGTTFAFPVQVTLAYDPAAVPAGADQGALRLHKAVGGAWREVSGSVVDTGANAVTGLVDGFSVYGVVTGVGTVRGPTISGFGTATIDGILSSGEWDFAGRINFLAAVPGGGTTPATLFVMNDATTLYLAVRFLRNVRDPGNSLEFAFDGNDDGARVSGDDDLRFVADPSLGFVDAHWTTTACPAPSSFCTRADTDPAAGGTSDGQGAFQHAGAFSVYELSHPLKSGDAAHDIAAGPGQAVGFVLTLRLEDASGLAFETSFPGNGLSGHILVQPAPLPLLAGVGTATVDGVMNAAEWEAAGCLFLPINVPGGGTTPGQFCVMNDKANLYVGLKFKRKAVAPGNSLAVEFDNDDDGRAAHKDDVIVYNPDVGFVDDFRTRCPTDPEASCALRDVDAGGRTDGTGAFAHEGDYATYEMSHPLNSGDEGHDFALDAGDRVGFFLSARIIRAPGSFPADFADTNFPGFRDYARLCVRVQGGQGTECLLASRFLAGHPCVTPILAGTPYDMNDPAWLTNTSDQNRNVCAYKFFAAFHMLGYNTEMGGSVYPSDPPHLRVLHAFQSQHGFPVGNQVTRELLVTLDALLARREAKIAGVARTFPLYNHMQPLHPNDVSKDWVAYIYQLPMTVLPASLQMGLYETVQCIWSQCLGFIQDASGNPWPTFPVLLTQDYRFVGAYFGPRDTTSRLPSAAVDVDTVLHEYAHYLDGQARPTDPAQPKQGSIDTFGFHDISYDMSQLLQGCAPRRSTDPKDWISRYGFVSNYYCPQAQLYRFWEEFAEAFSMYVAAGKHFRAAAQQNATIARKYDWLKSYVFQGLEYDTDLQRGLESGCNDVPGAQNAQPGYASCSESYVWDAELRLK